MVKKKNDKTNSKSKKINKPDLFNRIVISISLSIIFSLLFLVVYSNNISFEPKNVLNIILDDTYNFASDSSKNEFFNALNNQCNNLNKMLGQAGLSIDDDYATIKSTIDRAGIDFDADQMKTFLVVCKDLKTSSKKEFFNSFFRDTISNQLNINIDNSSMLELLETNINSMDLDSSKIDKSTVENIISKISSVSNFLNSPKVFVLMILLLALIIYLSFGFWNYLLVKIFGNFLSIGLWLIVPYLLVKKYVSTSSIDTSFIFQKATEAITGLSTNINTTELMTKIMKSFSVIFAELLYPKSLFILGMIFFVVGLVGWILFKFIIFLPSKEKD